MKIATLILGALAHGMVTAALLDEWLIGHWLGYFTFAAYMAISVGVWYLVGRIDGLREGHKIDATWFELCKEEQEKKRDFIYSWEDIEAAMWSCGPEIQPHQKITDNCGEARQALISELKANLTRPQSCATLVECLPRRPGLH